MKVQLTRVNWQNEESGWLGGGVVFIITPSVNETVLSGWVFVFDEGFLFCLVGIKESSNEVADLSPKNIFGNNPPQMVPRDLNVAFLSNLQPCQRVKSTKGCILMYIIVVPERWSLVFSFHFSRSFREKKPRQ